ncbi:MAG: ribosomal protein L13e [Nitrososphaerota archaeon]|nr:ribosomal protein L13e [Nitrososphaerota archaeon]
MSSEPRKTRKPKAAAKAEGAVKEVEEVVERAAQAAKREVKRVEKSAKGRAPRASLARPRGRAPEAMVMSRHETGMVSRKAKGFSLGELAGAGVAPRVAARWGASIDFRRRSVIEGNVGSLKEWHSHAVPEAVKEVRAAETRVEEGVKKIEKEAVAAGKEAARAVKKEAKKAEVAAKEKVEKKARPKKKSAS